MRKRVSEKRNILTALLLAAGLAMSPAGIISANASGADAVTASLPNDLAAAVCGHLSSSSMEKTGAADIVIPGFLVADADMNDPEDVRVLGDFWCLSYERLGKTLTAKDNAAFSGCLHFRLEDGRYSFLYRELTESSGKNDESAREIFGEYYDSWKESWSDYTLREAARAQLIADYVSAFHLPVTGYRDYGWDPLKLPEPHPDEDNLFLFNSPEEPVLQQDEIVVSPAEEPEPPQEDIYVVRRGDTLSKIAQAYGISTAELAERNRDTIIRGARAKGVYSDDLMNCANHIFPGEILAIPIPGSGQG